MAEDLQQPERPPVLAGHPPAPLEVQVSLKARSRIRQALVCPYCRDDAGRLDVVACAGETCGALYHQACWDECHAEYGGCAVFGCESHESKLVSYWGYLIRLFRLFVAALLFPPRIAKAIHDYEGEGFRAIYGHALTKAKRVYRFSNDSSNRQTFLVVLLGVPLSYVFVIGVLGIHHQNSSKAEVFGLLALLIGLPFVLLLLPAILALLLSFGFYAARLTARALSNELGALDRKEGSFLSRLRSGGGDKKGT